jgi:rod shape-determining protein MreC
LLNFIPEERVTPLRASALPLLDLFGRAGVIFDKVGALFGSGAGGGADVRALKDENRRLRAENAAMKEEVRKLGKALGFRSDFADAFGPAAPRTLSAKVIVKRDASNFRRTLVIDRGWRDGVKKGLAVVEGRTLVGVVSVAGYSSSMVQLSADPAFRVRVKLPGEGREGIAEGTGGEDFYMKIKYVACENPPVRGETALTTGFTGSVPQGLLVGYVMDSAGKPGGDFYAIGLKPSVNWRTLEVVEVVLGGADIPAVEGAEE